MTFQNFKLYSKSRRIKFFFSIFCFIPNISEALCQSMIIVNELDLNNTGMTLTQLKSLMINIPSHRSHIKELTLSGLDLSELSSHHLILPLNQVAFSTRFVSMYEGGQRWHSLVEFGNLPRLCLYTKDVLLKNCVVCW